MGVFNAVYALATSYNPGHSWAEIECNDIFVLIQANNSKGYSFLILSAISSGDHSIFNFE